MPQTCSVCVRPDRAAVDAALLNRTPIRIVADRFDLSLGAVNRHKAKCLVGVIQAAGMIVPDPRSAAIQASNSGLVEQVKARVATLDEAGLAAIELQRNALDDVRRARADRDAGGSDKALASAEYRLRMALEVLVKVHGGGLAQFVELGGKASGELQTGAQVNILVAGGQPRPEVAELLGEVRDGAREMVEGLPDAGARLSRFVERLRRWMGGS